MRARSTCLRDRLRSAAIAANCSRSTALKTTHTCCAMAPRLLKRTDVLCQGEAASQLFTSISSVQAARSSGLSAPDSVAGHPPNQGHHLLDHLVGAGED